MMTLVLAPTSPCSTDDFDTVPGERQASREDIWQQHVLEETQEVQNCISSMSECPRNVMVGMVLLAFTKLNCFNFTAAQSHLFLTSRGHLQLQ